MSGQWYVYILTDYMNTVLYTGITNDLARRVEEHRTGVDVGSFSKKYRLYKLVWYQEFDSPQEAISIEKRIKG
jgi:putative endonuclease